MCCTQLSSCGEGQKMTLSLVSQISHPGQGISQVFMKTFQKFCPVLKKASTSTTGFSKTTTYFDLLACLQKPTVSIAPLLSYRMMCVTQGSGRLTGS